MSSHSGGRGRSSLSSSSSKLNTPSSSVMPNHVSRATDSLSHLFRHDFSYLTLKVDHENRPLWVCPNGQIFLEAFNKFYKPAYDFLIAIAEPKCRPEFIHEYKITPYSLYAAASVGLRTNDLINGLNRLSKNELSEELVEFIRDKTEKCGKLRLVLKKGRYFLESPDYRVLDYLLNQSSVILNARLKPNAGDDSDDSDDDANEDVDVHPNAHTNKSNKMSIFDELAAEEHKSSAGAVVHPAGSSSAQKLSLLKKQKQKMLKKRKKARNQRTRKKYKYDDRGYIVEKLNTDGGAAIELFEVEEEDDSTTTTTTVDPHTGKVVKSKAKSGANKTKTKTKKLLMNQNSAMGLIAEDIDENERRRYSEVVSFEISESKIEEVRHECHSMDYPCVEEYDFRNDGSIPHLDITLKPIAKHRPYQEKSLSKMFGNGRARSGLIVLPCGAGKTMVGVTAVATVKKSCIIFANTTVSVHQWRQQILHWANIHPSLVIEFSSQNKQPLPDRSRSVILVTTYHMLGHSRRRSAKAETVMDDITTREWGLIILDEVHVAPASTFRKCASMIRSKCKLGLTATLLREDDKISDLYYLIGPKLYEANWLDLQKNGYLANVQCIEVWCLMTSQFYSYYLEYDRGSRARKKNRRFAQLLSDFNPNKFRAMQYLISVHEQRGDKVLVFSDNIPLLKHCAQVLKKPYIYGETHDRERKYWLHAFNHTSQTNCLFISSVGDTSIDLPDVNVVIQISSHYGSRRQEAQRLGRILRPKPRQGNEFNAFFYTLVSKDTVDMVYATKRQSFLVDQGYSFHVLTDLVTESTPGLEYGSATSKDLLLQQVLTIAKSGTNVLQEMALNNMNGESGYNNGTAKESSPQTMNGHGRDNNVDRLNRLTGNTGAYDEYQSKSINNNNHNGGSQKSKSKKRKAKPGKLWQAEQKRRKTLKQKRRQYLPH